MLCEGVIWEKRGTWEGSKLGLGEGRLGWHRMGLDATGTEMEFAFKPGLWGGILSGYGSKWK